MKIITIGRGEECNIRYDDPNISRRHAVMRLYPSGKIEIIDYSRNGTAVNGVKLGPEKMTRIKRSDSVSFAGVKTLDWKQVPNPSRPYKIAIIICIAFIGVLALVCAGVALYNAFVDNTSAQSEVVIDPPADPDKEKAKPGDNNGAGNGESAEQGKDQEKVDLENMKLPSGEPAKEVKKKAPKSDKSDKGDKATPKEDSKSDKADNEGSDKGGDQDNSPKPKRRW